MKKYCPSGLRDAPNDVILCGVAVDRWNPNLIMASWSSGNFITYARGGLPVLVFWVSNLIAIHITYHTYVPHIPPYMVPRSRGHLHEYINGLYYRYQRIAQVHRL